MADPSPSFAYNGGTVNEKESITAGADVVAELDSIDGVTSCIWSFVRTDDTTDVGDIALAPEGSVNQIVRFTLVTPGKSYSLQAEVNNGIAPSTGADSDLMRQVVKCYVPTAIGGKEVASDGEQDESILESDPSSGVCLLINDAIRTAGDGQLASYTVSTLPSATVAGKNILVTDETGGAVPCFSDGTNWRRYTDRAVAS